MKFLSSIVISGAMILCANNSFAAMPDCPTAAEVKANTKFVRLEPGLIPWWVSQTFTSHEHNWTVLMALKDPQYNTEEEALKDGQAIFDSRVVLMEPQVERKYYNGTMCYYTYSENHARDYVVIAVNPPEMASSFWG